MSCTMHVMSAIHISRSLRESRKKMDKTDENNSFPDIPTQSGLKKTISVARKCISYIAETTITKKTFLKRISNHKE